MKSLNGMRKMQNATRKILNAMLLLFLFSTAVVAQSNQPATTVDEAVENYEQFKVKVDTARAKQDSLIDLWEKRIEQMKLDQEKREKNASKKPE